MKTAIPVHLEHLLHIGKWVLINQFAVNYLLTNKYHPDGHLQRQMIALNPGTFPRRRTRRTGFSLNRSVVVGELLGENFFFACKIFIITPSFMERLCKEQVKNLSSEVRAIAFEYVRHVVAPTPKVGLAANFLLLPRYHAFTKMQFLDIGPMALELITLHGKWRRYKRFDAPQELRILLKKYWPERGRHGCESPFRKQSNRGVSYEVRLQRRLSLSSLCSRCKSEVKALSLQ